MEAPTEHPTHPYTRLARTMAPLSVSLRDAARLLGLSQRTVRNMARDGELPSVQPSGKGESSCSVSHRWING